VIGVPRKVLELSMILHVPGEWSPCNHVVLVYFCMTDNFKVYFPSYHRLVRGSPVSCTDQPSYHRVDCRGIAHCTSPSGLSVVDTAHCHIVVLLFLSIRCI